MRTILSFCIIILLTIKNVYCQVDTMTPSSNMSTMVDQRESSIDSMVMIEDFINELISEKDIIFSKVTIEASQFSWSRKWGATLKKPLRIEVARKKYKLKNAQIIYGFDNLKEGVYDFDTAMRFSFKGKEFDLAIGAYHNCNGSDCGYLVYFLVDKQTGRLYIFQAFRAPANRFFGDMNGDDELDLIIQDYLHVPEHNDKKSVLALYPYTLSSNGHFVRTKNVDGSECFLVGECNAHWYPDKFRIVGYNCLSFETK